jgi:hypothetical protein
MDETKQDQAQREDRGAQYQSPEPVKHWIDGYEERMRKHIKFALAYAADFNHGAPGHLDLLTIATLARHLSFATDQEPPYGP